MKNYCVEDIKAGENSVKYPYGQYAGYVESIFNSFDSYLRYLRNYEESNEIDMDELDYCIYIERAFSFADQNSKEILRIKKFLKSNYEKVKVVRDIRNYSFAIEISIFSGELTVIFGELDDDLPTDGSLIEKLEWMKENCEFIPFFFNKRNMEELLDKKFKIYEKSDFTYGPGTYQSYTLREIKADNILSKLINKKCLADGLDDDKYLIRHIYDTDQYVLRLDRHYSVQSSSPTGGRLKQPSYKENMMIINVVFDEVFQNSAPVVETVNIICAKDNYDDMTSYKFSDIKKCRSAMKMLEIYLNENRGIFYPKNDVYYYIICDPSVGRYYLKRDLEKSPKQQYNVNSSSYSSNERVVIDGVSYTKDELSAIIKNNKI